MIAIDTNILVRFLVGDDTQQARKVCRLFKDAENNNTELFVASVVILELLWVLESVYDIKRTDLLDAINQLMLMPLFQFENRAAIQQFIPAAQASSYDLSDLFIAHTAHTCGCDSVLTFDKKASRYTLFDLL